MADLKKEKEVTFKPVTEGLGFHPFSNGLPYAPVSKAPVSKVSQSISQALNPPPGRPGSSHQGTGAVAAGPASFLGQSAYPSHSAHSAQPPSTPPGQFRTADSGQTAQPLYQPQRPSNNPAAQNPFSNLRVNVPVASSSLPLPARHGSGQSISAALAHSGVEPTRSAVQDLPEKTEYGFDYPIKRAFAFLVDVIVNLSLGCAALVIGLWKQGLNPQMLAHTGVIWVTLLFLVFFGWALMTAQEIAFGTTLGKRLFGLYVVGSTSAVLARALLFLPSFALIGGVALALFDEDKRCLHDILTGIQPQEIARL